MVSDDRAKNALVLTFLKMYDRKRIVLHVHGNLLKAMDKSSNGLQRF